MWLLWFGFESDILKVYLAWTSFFKHITAGQVLHIPVLILLCSLKATQGPHNGNGPCTCRKVFLFSIHMYSFQILQIFSLQPKTMQIGDKLNGHSKLTTGGVSEE